MFEKHLLDIYNQREEKFILFFNFYFYCILLYNTVPGDGGGWGWHVGSEPGTV